MSVNPTVETIEEASDGDRHVPLKGRAPLDAWAAGLGAIAVKRLTVEARVERPIALQTPLNAVVRGLLGARLRALRCRRDGACAEACAEPERCDYGRVFETSPEAVGVAHGRSPARPFWLSGLPAVERLPVGYRIVARLDTVGPATRLLPYLDVALRDALERLGDGESRVRLFGSTTAPVSFTPSRGGRRVRFRTLTPLVVDVPDAALDDCPEAPWLAALVRAAVRRGWSLLTAYAPETEQPPVAFPELGELRTVEGGLWPTRTSRWSARQKKRIPIRGLAGEAVIEGDLVPTLLPLLRAVELFGVGKATSMGFGRVHITEEGTD